MTFDEFVQELEGAIEAGWSPEIVGDSLRLMAPDGVQHCYCPVTAVARHLGQGDYPLIHYKEAGEHLGLTTGLTTLLVWSADSDVQKIVGMGVSTVGYRPRMLHACGLEAK